MFHFTPKYYSLSPRDTNDVYSLPSSYVHHKSMLNPYPAPSYVSNATAARDRYLQALAEAEAAEEEMLAAEALQTEETALRRRLQEIAEQKKLLSKVPATTLSPAYSRQTAGYTQPTETFSDYGWGHDDSSFRREIKIKEARQQAEETEYGDLLRRQEGLVPRTRQASQQPGDEPARPQLGFRTFNVNDACCAANSGAQFPLMATTIYQRPTPVGENIPTVPHFNIPRRFTPNKQAVHAAPRRATESPQTLAFNAEETLRAMFKGILAPSTKAAPLKTKFPTNELDSYLSSVNTIEASFQKLRSEFSFPSEIAFNDSPSDANPISKLSYSSVNNPIREYEQALTKLISRLDEISSVGNEKLRLRRKEVVLAIEQTIQDLESEVEQRCVQKAAVPKSTLTTEVTTPVIETTNFYTRATEEALQVEEKASSPKVVAPALGLKIASPNAPHVDENVNSTETSAPTSSTFQPTAHVEDVESPPSPVPSITLDSYMMDPAPVEPGFHAESGELASDVPSEVHALDLQSSSYSKLEDLEIEDESLTQDSLDESEIIGEKATMLLDKQHEEDGDWTEVDVQ